MFVEKSSVLRSRKEQNQLIAVLFALKLPGVFMLYVFWFLFLCIYYYITYTRSSSNIYMQEQLVVEKQIQSQHATSSSANGFVVNEGAIFSKVFGDRRGHNIGLGRKLKRPSGLPCSSNTSTPSSYETMKQMIQGAQEASDRHHEEQNRKRYQDLINALLLVIPNANLANFPPFESTPTSQFDYNAFLATTNQVSSQQSGDGGDDEDLSEDN